MDLTAVQQFVRDTSGLVFDVMGVTKLHERVGDRMRRLGIASVAHYLQCLRRDETEFNTLISLLTVNETYFFREPAHLDVLTDRIVPETLRHKRPGDRIRILSAGCSTGEEAYSIVIALIEKFGSAIFASVDVLGIDIDADVLARAPAGVFAAHSFRGMGDAMKGRYFDGAGRNRYAIKETVKTKVRFLAVNLLSDTYPAALDGVDVIFYRNVSIYFQPVTRRSVFTKLASLLNERGYMFLASAETMSHDIGVLSLIEVGGVFLYQKRPASRDEGEPSPRPVAAAEADGARRRPAPRSARIGRGREPAGTDTADPRRLFEEAKALGSAGNYDDALRRLDLLIARVPSFVAAHPLKACILVKAGRWDEAEGACLDGLARDAWRVDLHLFLGVIARARGDDDTAVKRFREAIYARSSCWPAHFHLAEIYQASGDLERSSREYDIALRLVQGQGTLDLDLGVFAGACDVEEMARVCGQRAARARRMSRSRR